MDQEKLTTLLSPGRANGIVGNLAAFARRIPRLKNAIELRLVRRIIPHEPLGLDDAAARRRRHLQILSREHPRAHGGPQQFQRNEGLALEVERLAFSAVVATGS